MKTPFILSIDTSCDETSVAITNGFAILSNVIFSQVNYHAPFGGVFPTVAKREHESKILPAIHLALQRARLTMSDLAAIAITFGPGLAPALEVGITHAKQLAHQLKIPLIPVDHIEGHIYAAFCTNRNGNPHRAIFYPFLSFVVSGCHTELVIVDKPLSYTIIGQKQDDAAGEAFDKCGRLLGLGYPGGAAIERLAIRGNEKSYKLPIPMINSHDLNFSYSGLKTAFKRLVESLPDEDRLNRLEDLSASLQYTIVKSLAIKLKKALDNYPVQLVTAGGGVIENMYLKKILRSLVVKRGLPFYTPTLHNLNGDNAAMIGAVASLKLTRHIYLTGDAIATLERVARTHLQLFTEVS